MLECQAIAFYIGHNATGYIYWDEANYYWSGWGTGSMDYKLGTLVADTGSIESSSYVYRVGNVVNLFAYLNIYGTVTGSETLCHIVEPEFWPKRDTYGVYHEIENYSRGPGSVNNFFCITQNGGVREAYDSTYAIGRGAFIATWGV